MISNVVCLGKTDGFDVSELIEGNLFVKNGHGNVILEVKVEILVEEEAAIGNTVFFFVLVQKSYVVLAQFFSCKILYNKVRTIGILIPS